MTEKSPVVPAKNVLLAGSTLAGLSSRGFFHAAEPFTTLLAFFASCLSFRYPTEFCQYALQLHDQPGMSALYPSCYTITTPPVMMKHQLAPVLNDLYSVHVDKLCEHTLFCPDLHLYIHIHLSTIRAWNIH